MRNDVKFGLTIGGIFALVLGIWLIVNHSNKKVAEAQNEGLLAPKDDEPVAPETPTNPRQSDGHSPITPADPSRTVAQGDPVRTPRVRTDWGALLEQGPHEGTLVSNPGRLISDPVIDPRPLSTTQPSSGGRTYKVQSGDSLYVISENLYGTSKYWKRLAAANPQINPNRLRLGSILQVPDISTFATVSGSPAAVRDSMMTPPATNGDMSPHSGGTPRDGGARNPVPPTDTSAGGASLDRSTSYQVHSSDTLIRIARRLYGSDQAWEKIYQANRDVIGANPAALKVNMILRLPSPPTVASVN